MEQNEVVEDEKRISFRFHHGLGDCVHFACAVPLWTSRGYRVQVECKPDKACLFEAAGAEIVDQADVNNPYLHAPKIRNPDILQPWEMNKCSHNLTAKPMPHIGTTAELWPKLVETRLSLRPFLSRESMAEIDSFVNKLSGPLILLHTRGNSGPGSKSVPDLETPLYCELLERTDATLLALDWDNRVKKIDHSRFVHLQRDFRTLSVPELAYLIDRANLLIGVDSGPLHLCRFTDTPALGLWHGHTPSHFALPRERTAHICTSGHGAWTKTRRHNFHVIDCGERLTPEFITQQAIRVLDMEYETGTAARQLVLNDLLGRSAATSVGSTRDNAFPLIADYLIGCDSPQIIETGCIRSEDDFTAGFSTYLFGMILDTIRAGKLDTVDISPDNVKFARKWVEPFTDRVDVHQGDSVKFLQEWTGPAPDLAYLDSLDVGHSGYAEHCLEEAQAAHKILKPGGLLVIDDTYRHGQKWQGKGTIAVPMLLDNGYWMMYSGYQTILKKPDEVTT